MDGVELSDLTAARIGAIRLSGEILRSEASEVARGGGWYMEVADEGGRMVYRVDLIAADQPVPVVKTG